MKKTTIIIQGKPFTYIDEKEDITYDTITAISTDDAKDLLETTKRLFDQCGIRFSLAFGTLLGAVRDKDIIKGDEDVDIFIDNEDLLRNNLPFLYENGLKVCRFFEHRFYSFHTTNNSYIDVYIKEKMPFSIWSLWCDCLNGNAVPKRYVNKFDTIEFLGMEFLCPHNPERILCYWYGKSWKTPISGHIYTYESPSRYWWKTNAKKRWDLFVYVLIMFIFHPLKFWKKLYARYR